MSAAPIDRRLLPPHCVLSESDATIGGQSLRELAAKYDTPLFVFDERALRERCREAAAAFDPGTAFASKSFLCGAMARLAAEEGLYIDVATEGEFDIVTRAGIPASRVVVHGNNKSDAELTRACQAGVHRLVVDNFDEVRRLGTLADRDHPVKCMVRVTPGVSAHTHEFVRTGQEDTKFGLSVASGEADRALEELGSMPGVELVGVHTHIGSQIFDLAPFTATVEILAPLVGAHGLTEVCVGGGLGVPYITEEAAPTITEWGAAVREAANRLLPAGVRVTAEPGRAVVARAAVTIYRVGAIKAVPQRTYLAVDGGMSDNPRPVLYGSGYEAIALNSPLAERDRAFRIVGKHCESGDVLIDEAWLSGNVGVGDLIVTPVTGAYGYSMASNYNRTPRPAVVFVADGHERLVLRRETLDDLARLEVAPDQSS